MRRWEEAPRTFERRTTSKYTFSLVSPFLWSDRGERKKEEIKKEE